MTASSVNEPRTSASANEGGVTTIISKNQGWCHEWKGNEYITLNVKDQTHIARDLIQMNTIQMSKLHVHSFHMILDWKMVIKLIYT